jgi:hypothetical protein
VHDNRTQPYGDRAARHAAPAEGVDRRRLAAFGRARPHQVLRVEPRQRLRVQRSAGGALRGPGHELLQELLIRPAALLVGGAGRVQHGRHEPVAERGTIIY